MAVTLAKPKILTYEEYLAEGETKGRYDIIDGVRYEMTTPSRRHQDIVMGILDQMRNFQKTSGAGRAYLAPSDILVRKYPLRTRQPDLYFISNGRLSKCEAPESSAPLVAPPEVVVEVLSPSDGRRALTGNLLDYAAIGVNECWVVSLEAETVQVLALSGDVYREVDIYSVGATLSSVVFSELTVCVDDIFKD